MKRGLKIFGGILAGVVLLGVLFLPFPNRTTSTAHGEIEVVEIRLEYANAQLVRHGDHAVLFDTGYGRNADALIEAIRSAGVEPRELDAIIVSHGHADHAGGAASLKERLGVPLLGGPGDRPQFESGDMDPLCATDFIAEQRLAEDQASHFEPVAIDTWIEDSTDLHETMGVPLRLVPLPGHTEGSLVAIGPDFALLSDLVRGAIVGGGAATHLYMCDLEDNRRDIRAVLEELAPEATTFYVGHFGPLSRDELAAFVE